MTLDEYLNLTDEEVQFLVAYNYGKEINNPRHGSAVDPNEDPEQLEPEEEDPRDLEIPDHGECGATGGERQ